MDDGQRTQWDYPEMRALLHFGAGAALDRIGASPERVEASYRLALKEDPKILKVYTALAVHLVDRGDIEGALDVLDNLPSSPRWGKSAMPFDVRMCSWYEQVLEVYLPVIEALLNHRHYGHAADLVAGCYRMPYWSRIQLERPREARKLEGMAARAHLGVSVRKLKVQMFPDGYLQERWWTPEVLFSTMTFDGSERSRLSWAPGYLLDVTLDAVTLLIVESPEAQVAQVKHVPKLELAPGVTLFPGNIQEEGNRVWIHTGTYVEYSVYADAGAVFAVRPKVYSQEPERMCPYNPYRYTEFRYGVDCAEVPLPSEGG